MGKLFRKVLLIRNVLFTLVSFLTLIFGIILVATALKAKINGDDLSYAVGLVLAIIFSFIGLITSIYTIVYLIISYRYLKEKGNNKIQLLSMLLLEIILLVASIVLGILEIKNIPILILSIIILIQSIVVMTILMFNLMKER